MSVINQVLSQLARRGVHVEQEQDLVRVVPPPRSRRMQLAVLLLLLAGATWWWLARGIDVGSVKLRASQAVATVAPVMSAITRAGSDIAAADIMASHSAVPVSAVIPHSTVQAVVPASSAPVIVSASAVRPQIAPQAVPKAKVNVPPKPAALAVQDKSPGKTRIATSVPAASRAVAPKPEVRPDNLKLAPAAPPETGEMPMKQVSRAQQAEAEFRRGVESMQAGRTKDAMASYQAALQHDGAHDAARQALVVLLQEEKRSGDAEQLLQERLKDRPQHTGFAMLLARLQVERGATGEALATLERSVSYAETKADYLAFLAALQQRNSRHAEAVTHYQAALRLQPGNGAWLMGYGISLQALRRTEEAKAAYQQALESKNLSPDLKTFIQRKLNGL